MSNLPAMETYEDSSTEFGISGDGSVVDLQDTTLKPAAKAIAKSPPKKKPVKKKKKPAKKAAKRRPAAKPKAVVAEPDRVAPSPTVAAKSAEIKQQDKSNIHKLCEMLAKAYRCCGVPLTAEILLMQPAISKSADIQSFMIGGIMYAQQYIKDLSMVSISGDPSTLLGSNSVAQPKVYWNCPHCKTTKECRNWHYPGVGETCEPCGVRFYDVSEFTVNPPQE